MTIAPIQITPIEIAADLLDRPRDELSIPELHFLVETLQAELGAAQRRESALRQKRCA